MMERHHLSTILLALLPLCYAGCKEDLLGNSEAVNCIMGFAMFMSNMNEGMVTSEQSDPSSAVFNLICSKEGKAAFSCVMKYMTECPEFLQQPDGSDPTATLQQIPGFDMQTFFSEGGLDAACAMLVGPCSKVKNCFNMTSPSGVVKRGVPVTNTMDYYLVFQKMSSEMCGELKNQMTCVLNALESCPPSVVDMVEKQFEMAIKMSIPDDRGIVSFKDTKDFMQKECPKIPKGFEDDTCIQRVLMSQNFTDCSDNVTTSYSQARTCTVHKMSKSCIMDHMEPTCGDDKAMFFARNSHFIFPGIPSNCEALTSASDVITTPCQLLILLPALLLSIM